MTRARHPYRADALLLIAALIWGTAFVAQRTGMEHMGPMAFNGIRFALGALLLLPLCRSQHSATAAPYSPRQQFLVGLGSGLILFAGASLQQVGIVDTTAGKAGFITGLYVVLVPIIGLTIGRHTHAGAWIGATCALAGLYLLSVTGAFGIGRGDLLVLAGAFFWAGHILYLDRTTPHMHLYRLAALQAATCAVLSLAVAAATESATWTALRRAAVPLLYAGFMSVGVAYTLQVVAQKDAPPTHAAILLSLEAVFAALAGALLLGESMTPRGLAGCTLMLAGMVLSQLGIGQPRGARHIAPP